MPSTCKCLFSTVHGICPNSTDKVVPAAELMSENAFASLPRLLPEMANVLLQHARRIVLQAMLTLCGCDRPF